MDDTNIKLLKVKADEHITKANKINSLIKARAEVTNAIEDILFLKRNAGRMIFTGQSGKIDDSTNLKEIYINGLAGCVAVPNLLLELAKTKLDQIEFEICQLLGR